MAGFLTNTHLVVVLCESRIITVRVGGVRSGVVIDCFITAGKQIRNLTFLFYVLIGVHIDAVGQTRLRHVSWNDSRCVKGTKSGVACCATDLTSRVQAHVLLNALVARELQIGD